MRAPLPRIHAITDERVARRADVGEVARALAAGCPGIALHARGHALTGREHYELAVRLRTSPSASQSAPPVLLSARDSSPPVPLSAYAERGDARDSSLLFINDRLDVALAVNAHGVQLRSDSIAVADARKLGPHWWIGCSVHALDEARAARDAGADYLLVGPVFATATHAGSPPLGLEALPEIVALGLPVIAIGGVTVERTAAVRATGAWGVAAIRALWDAADPGEAARAMCEVRD